METYAAGPDWELPGPARDVADVYTWLTNNGVPPANIQALVSPLPASQRHLDDADIESRAATSIPFRKAWEQLQKQEGDLLVLFWAGHGAIQTAGQVAIRDENYRLFLADATREEKRNVDWDMLQRALVSDQFARFRHQIVLVDACRDYRRDFKTTTTGEVMTAGVKNDRCHQFVLFAASAGETTKTDGDEGRGVFTREVLRALKDEPASSWPPNMEAVTTRVKEAFKGLKTVGDVDKTPVFLSIDWDGNLSASETLTSRAGKAEVTFALVIGISQYDSGVEPGLELKAEQFTNLAAARQDAEAVYAFWSKQPDCIVLKPLLDESATRAAILESIDDLRKRCHAPGVKNPIVQIFFSGHGWKDDDGRCYLVPHDAKRDQLFGTALWDRVLDVALNQLSGAKCVLFLDACHSGGIGEPYKKDLPWMFDPHSVSGDTRLVVASCGAGQRSYEVGNRGLFTSHLLQLLGSDVHDPSDQESQAGDEADRDDDRAGYSFAEKQIDLGISSKS